MKIILDNDILNKSEVMIMPLVGKKFNGNLFLCNKCDFFREEADFLENPSLTRTCPFCGKKHGGQLTNTGKSYEEWEAILEQQPDAPLRIVLVAPLLIVFLPLLISKLLLQWVLSIKRLLMK
ncbi:hypothetical protein [Senimuribacter intestinalis]|uniref:hypothetical protein n=1 Tax=Senimuribacter intestinalis TaxID=2941507 RepID=UPI00203F3330|nr:hypothetical protein [Senimuribacter intestinalis]